MEQRVITFPAAVSLVVASMVGIGVFTSVGFQLASMPSGFPIILLWLLGGVVSLCGALCYAELVSMLPRSGGEYHLLREAYHPLVGFLAGWISITAGFVAPLAALAMAFSSYLVGLGTPVPPGAIACGIILVVAIPHLGSLRLVGRFLSLMTALKIVLVVAFIVGALAAGIPSVQSIAPRAGDGAWLLTPAFATSMVYVMFAYSGWNGAAYIAGEVRDPQRVIPRAFVAGVIVVTLLYVALNAVFLCFAPWNQLSGHVEAGLIAAEAIFGNGPGRWMGTLIAFGIVSSIAGYTWSGSRVMQRMGQDYRALAVLARENRWAAPHAAIVLQTALVLGMIATGAFDAVVNYLTALLQLCSLLAVAAVMHLRRTRPDAPRPFRVPWYPVTPIVFIVVSIWMLVFVVLERPLESLLGMVTVLLGVALYVAVAKSATGEQEPGRSAHP